MSQPSKILIVDDVALSREMLNAMLASEAYELSFAHDGPHALQQAAQLFPDLILLDVMMPGMDGFEVCQRIRATPDLAEVPIILITALDDRESRLRGIEAGADDFISKPLDRVELRTRVRAITRLNRYRSLLIERSQRQQIQQEIAHRDYELAALHEADRLKNQFVSDVAHELRTPLFIMTLTSDNLATLYDQLDDQQRKKLIAQMRKQTTMLSTLVTNVLDIARIDNQRYLPEHQPVDLVQLVYEEAERQLPLAEQKGQTLRVEGRKRLMIMGDGSQLSQIVCNLLHNAVKYTPHGGQIVCTCAELVATTVHALGGSEARTLPLGTWAQVQVADTGIGIPLNEQCAIFERFYRVKTQGNVSGTGLGLAIVKELVYLHHGHIGITSVPDQGSCFTVYFPLCEEASDDNRTDYGS